MVNFNYILMPKDKNSPIPVFITENKDVYVLTYVCMSLSGINKHPFTFCYVSMTKYVDVYP